MGKGQIGAMNGISNKLQALQQGAMVALGLLAAVAVQSETEVAESAAMPSSDLQAIQAQPGFPGAPSFLLPAQHQVTFDVSNQIQLSLMLDTHNVKRELTGTRGVWRPLNSVSLRAGVELEESGRAKTPQLGACLAADNSDSYFDCLSAEAQTQVYSVGASWQPVRNLTFSVDYYNRNAEENDAPHNALALMPLGGAATLGSNPDLLRQVHSKAMGDGVDLSLSCDFSAGPLGALELALQWSRFNDPGLTQPTASDFNDPYTAASLGVGWERGQFSGDFTSRSRFYDQNDQTRVQSNEWTTFDINFAWRTPWNASLSVGARNVLNRPAPTEHGLVDLPIDDVFGRVPYVRYQQDL